MNLQSTATTIILALLFLLNLSFLQGTVDRRTIVFVVLYVSWTQFYRLSPKILTGFTLLAIFLFYKKIALEFIPILNERESQSPVIFFASLGALVFLAFLTLPASKLPARWKQPLVLLWAFYILFPYLVRISPLGGDARLWIKKAWLLVGHCWWYFVFLVQDSARLPRDPLNRIGFLFPISQFIAFQRISGPYALGAKAFDEFKSEEPLSDQRRRCILFLIGTLGFTSLPYLHSRLFPGIPKSFEFTRLFFESKISFSQYLNFGFINLSAFWAGIFGCFNLMGAFYRVGGYHYPASSSFKIFRSRDFVDYLNSISAYAKEIYLNLFYLPIFLNLHRIKSIQLRVVLTTLISIVFGATLMHYVTPQLADRKFFEEGFIYFVLEEKPDFFISFCVIATVSSLAQLRRIRQGAPKVRPIYLQTFAVLGYFSFFLLDFLLTLWPRGTSLKQAIEIYVRLLS